jgi:hypothetical protein
MITCHFKVSVLVPPEHILSDVSSLNYSQMTKFKEIYFPKTQFFKILLYYYFIIVLGVPCDIYKSAKNIS